MRRTILMAAGAALLCTSAADALAPLCRDSKGLFTPCVAGAPGRVPSRHHAAAPAQETPAAAAASASPTTASPAPKAKSSSPRITRAKLCRDTKGLFTPCPR